MRADELLQIHDFHDVAVLQQARRELARVLDHADVLADPVGHVHDLELALVVQLVEFGERVVAALLQNGLVALVGFIDEILGGGVLVRQLAQAPVEVRRRLQQHLDLGLALGEQVFEFLFDAQLGVRYRIAMVYR